MAAPACFQALLVWIMLVAALGTYCPPIILPPDFEAPMILSISSKVQFGLIAGIMLKVFE